ncbi:FHA domain-containing protein [Actinomycetes bacterium KLBMP 9759]
MTEFVEVWSSGQRRMVVLTGRMTIGRGDANDIALPQDKTISTLHAALEPLAGRWCIEDLGSRNGTFVDGDRLHARYALRDEDEIVVGQARIVFHVGEPTTVSQTQGADPPPKLTDRERAVLLELCRPLLTDREGYREPPTQGGIAVILRVSASAVQHHLTSLYDKFGIADGSGSRRGRLASEAIRRRAISRADLKDR